MQRNAKDSTQVGDSIVVAVVGVAVVVGVALCVHIHDIVRVRLIFMLFHLAL